MAKYKKKPLVLEAEQWLPGMEIEGVISSYESYTPMDLRSIAKLKGLRNGEWAWIETLEGPHMVNSGDWVITGVKGEKYPCKPDIFAETYELAE